MGKSVGKKIGVLLLFLLLTGGNLMARAQNIVSLEEQDFSAWKNIWETWLPNERFDTFLQSIVNGTMSDPGKLIWGSLQGRLESWGKMAIEVLAQMILMVMLEIFASQIAGFVPQTNNKSSIQWIILTASILFLSSRMLIALKEAIYTLEQLSHFINTAIPVLLPMMMTSGWTATSGILQPATLSLSVWMDQWLRSVFSQGISVLMMLRMADSFHEKRILKGVINVGKRVIQWFMGLSLTGFVAIVGLQGSAMMNYDSLTMRSAKYAVDSTIPGVGGYFADLLDTAVMSAQTIRGSMGIVSLIVVVMICIEPVIYVGFMTVTMDVASALGMILGNSPISALYSDMASLLRLLLYGLITSIFMVMIIMSLACMAGTGI